MAEMKRVGRKLLIVSLGVASVSYGACGSSSSRPDGAVDGVVADKSSKSPDAGTDGSVGTPDGSTDAADVAPDRQFIGNIV